MKKGAGYFIGLIIFILGILLFIGGAVLTFTSVSNNPFEGNGFKFIPMIIGGMVLFAVGGIVMGVSGSKNTIKNPEDYKGSRVYRNLSSIASLMGVDIENPNANSNANEEDKKVICPYCGSENSSKDSKCKSCNGNLRIKD